MALVFLGAALWVARGAPWPLWATPFQIGVLALSGLIGFAFGDNWQFRSLVILGPGRATLLSSLAPLFTVMIGWPALGEVPGPLALLGMALTLGGLSWVLVERERREHTHVEGSARMGVLAGVLGALGQAGGYVLSKVALRTGVDPLSATVIRVGAAALAVWLVAVAAGEARRSLEALRDRRGAGFMVAGAFFGPFLGVTLSLTALEFIQAGIAASITAIYPLLAMAISARFHGERFTTRSLLGALIAVAGVVVLFLR